MNWPHCRRRRTATGWSRLWFWFRFHRCCCCCVEGHTNSGFSTAVLGSRMVARSVPPIAGLGRRRRKEENYVKTAANNGITSRVMFSRRTAIRFKLSARRGSSQTSGNALSGLVPPTTGDMWRDPAVVLFASPATRAPRRDESRQGRCVCE